MLDNYRDLIDELLGTPSLLRDLLADGAPSPEAGRLIAELRDRDAAVLARLQAMIRERDPILPPLGQAEPATEANTVDALARFESARGELISLLMNLTLKDWERTAIEAAGDEVGLADEVERHVEFDEDEVERIRAALAS